MEQYVIFSLARSGSTSLAHIVNVLRPKSCVLEPFTRRKFGGYFHNLALNESLESALSEIRYKFGYIGIKHVCNPTGWPFVEGSVLNDQLLLCPGLRVVLLRRRNLLKRAVSQLIAEQTSMWNVENELQNKKRKGANLETVEISRLSDIIDQDRQFHFESVSKLESAKQKWMTVDFESLFEDSSRLSRVRVLNSVLLFLGYENIAEDRPIPDAIEEMLFGRKRYGSSLLYSEISGIDRINRSLGSPETGFLTD